MFEETKMKKAFLITLTLILCLCACTQKQEDTPAGSLEDMLSEIYLAAQIDDQNYKNWLSTGLVTTEITKDNEEYYFGTAVDFDEAIASEPMMSAQAFSVCLIRIKKGSDIAKIKSDIKESVNPNKWIYVGVSDENVLIASRGNIVILIMADDSQVFLDAFNSLE